MSPFNLSSAKSQFDFSKRAMRKRKSRNIKLICDYVQTRRVNESCVWHVDGKEIMICGQRPAGFVYAQVHKNTQQTTGRALGKGSGSLPQSSTLVRPRTSRCQLMVKVTSLNWKFGQSGTN